MRNPVEYYRNQAKWLKFFDFGLLFLLLGFVPIILWVFFCFDEEPPALMVAAISCALASSACILVAAWLKDKEGGSES